jgi:hypothetical protein
VVRVIVMARMTAGVVAMISGVSVFASVMFHCGFLICGRL